MGREPTDRPVVPFCFLGRVSVEAAHEGEKEKTNHCP